MPHHLTDTQRCTIRLVVTAEQEDVATRIEALEQELTSIIESGDLANVDDEHDPEGATIAYERAFSAALLASARSTLTVLDRVHDAIDHDEAYGTCSVCGQPIGLERLLARPAADRCVPCARRSG